jgi:hypothetical protein
MMTSFPAGESHAEKSLGDHTPDGKKKQAAPGLQLAFHNSMIASALSDHACNTSC